MPNRITPYEALRAVASVPKLLLLGRLAIVPSKGVFGDWIRTKMANRLDRQTLKERSSEAQKYIDQGRFEEFELACDVLHNLADAIRDKRREDMATEMPVNRFADLPDRLLDLAEAQAERSRMPNEFESPYPFAAPTAPYRNAGPAPYPVAYQFPRQPADITV